MTKRNTRFWKRASQSGTSVLLRFLEKQGFVSQDHISRWNEATADNLPIAHYARVGLYDEEEVVHAVAQHLQIHVCPIHRSQHDALLALLDEEPLCNIPANRLHALRVLPIEISEQRFKLAMANPFDQDGIGELEFTLNRSAEVFIAKESDITNALGTKLHLGDQDTIDFIVKGSELEPEVEKKFETAPVLESSALSEDTNASPVVRLVNKILSQAIHQGASDLHITPQKDCLSVKARIDGIIRPMFDIPDQFKDPVIARIKVLSGMDLSEKRRPQDSRLRIKTNFGIKDLRISTVPTAHGENLVARILASDLSNLNLASLGTSEEMVERLNRMLKITCKVILVTGPTGAGKTSTLYACLLHLMDGQKNIITLEDPIEYRIDKITQIQVNSKVDLGFAEGLRSILRQDPDVVLVGEIRDEETASISMKTAQTGHLVLSTLHTNSAPAAITRLRDLGLPSYLIASSLGAVIAQRLVRRLCQKCSILLEEENKERYKSLGLNVDSIRQPVGCSDCDQTGYQGRVAVFSLLEITNPIAQAIRAEASEQEIIDQAHIGGYQSLRESAIELIHSGVTSVPEVERVLGFLDGPDETYGPASGLNGSQVGQIADSNLRKRKILLVEDDRDARAIFRHVFEREMFEVIEAEDGYQALEAIYHDLPDIVVSDMEMPKITGYELLQRLKNDPRVRHLPVLMLTGKVDEEEELKLMKAGADDFVSKTTNPEIIATRIRRLLS